MVSTLKAKFLSTLTLLTALLLCALGAPVETEVTDILAGDSSGEEEDVVTHGLLSASPFWGLILGATARHQKEFEEEFKSEMTYYYLDNYRFPAIPAGCPTSNFSKEACLKRLAEGLNTYMVLLMYVEQEYPNNAIVMEIKPYNIRLINLIKEKMKNPRLVTNMTSSQQEKLLSDLNNPIPFERKMTAHCILRQFHNFLRDGIVAVRKRERGRTSRVMKPNLHFFTALKN
ncbi:interleukin-6-like [Cynoglossus semilaevis]|uniref:interleukin-6-like n=1 Tax=Cynoglossus semilaevis TaxID=244447 RepID=UPI00049832D0|nr:interleukin-6-like [Cynoglossus semilaevis]